MVAKCDALNNELQAKSKQLEHTASLLRKASEEREAARREAAAARAEASQKEAAVTNASQLEEAKLRATAASQEANDLKAALSKTTESLAHSDEALRETQAALAAIEREAAAGKEAQHRAEQRVNEASARLNMATRAVEALKKVIAFALAKFLELLKRLKDTQAALVGQEEALAELRDLRHRDEEREEALRVQVNKLMQETSAKAAIQLQLDQYKLDNAAKAKALEEMERLREANVALLAALNQELESARRALSEANQQSTALSAELKECRKQIDAQQQDISLMRSNLDERMRWIESLETSSRVQRQRINELWSQLKEQQRLEAELSGPAPRDGSSSAASHEAIVVAAELGVVKARLASLEEERASDHAKALRLGLQAQSGESPVVTVDLETRLMEAEARALQAEKALAGLRQDLEDVANAEDAGPSALTPAGGAKASPSRSGRRSVGATVAVEGGRPSRSSLLKAEVQQKDARIGELEEEVKILREMVKARESDSRTKELEISRLRKEPTRSRPLPP